MFDKKDPKEVVTIKPTERGREYWLSRSHLSDPTRERLAAADIILLPIDPFVRDDTSYNAEAQFPEGVESVYWFIKDEAGDQANVDIYVEGDDYSELALHTLIVDLGVFLVVGLVAPVFVNLASEFLKRRIWREDTRVKLRIVYQDNDRAFEIDCEAPPEVMAKSVLPQLAARIQRGEFPSGTQEIKQDALESDYNGD